MEDIKQKFLNFHPAHAIGFGLLAGTIAQKNNMDFKKTALIVSIGSYAYMNTYGHILPWNIKNSSAQTTSGILVVADPEKIKTDPSHDNTSVTPHFDKDYYDGFDMRLKDAMKKGYGDLNDYIAQHSTEGAVDLAEGIYRELGMTI